MRNSSHRKQMQVLALVLKEGPVARGALIDSLSEQMSPAEVEEYVDGLKQEGLVEEENGTCVKAPSLGRTMAAMLEQLQGEDRVPGTGMPASAQEAMGRYKGFTW